MHVIAGEFKGISLSFPKDRVFRPTQSRVKEALFSILAIHKIEDQRMRFLDLCCGTGSIGIEAVSRGVDEAVLVDVDVAVAKENVARLESHFLGVSSRFKIVRKEGGTFLKSEAVPFDFIFIDPPWDKEPVYVDLLKGISGFGILCDTGILVCEHPKKIRLPDISGLVFGKIYQYGDTVLQVFHRKLSA